MRFRRPDWQVSLNTDGSVAYTLMDYNTFIELDVPLILPRDNSTIIGAEELNGTMTTSNISTFLFNNVYLYEGNINNCCVLGFHGPDVEPGGANGVVNSNGFLNNYDMIYASYITPGIFGGGLDGRHGDLATRWPRPTAIPSAAPTHPIAYVPWWYSGPGPVVQPVPTLHGGRRRGGGLQRL